MVTLSPTFTSCRSWIFFPLTSTPDLEPVSQMNHPSSRRRSTAWSRDMVASGRVMSQLRLRPMEFSQ